MAVGTTNTAVVRSGTPTIVRRNTAYLAVAQCMGWVGIQTVVLFGAPAAYQITGDQRPAGLPLTFFTLFAALSAPVAGRLMDRIGRRVPLMAGQLLMALGSLICFLAMLAGSLPGLAAGAAITGMGTGTTALARSAAADMYPAARRGAGMSLVITGGAVGAILGPLLFSTLSGWITAIHGDPLVWSWLAVPPLMLLGMLALGMMRPDPRDIAANLELYYPGETAPDETSHLPARPMKQILSSYPAVLAITTTALLQAGMVLLMSTTPLTMRLQGHGDAVYGVLTGHFAGMLALSILIGRVVDRLGRRPVIAGGTLVLMAGAISMPLFQNPLYVGAGLFLVGLGWSMGYVAGNALLADSTRPLERSRTLGANDLLSGLMGAVASLLGGIFLDAGGYLLVGAAGVALACIPLVMSFGLRERSPGLYGTRNE